MDPATTGAIVISIASLATAGVGYWVQRKQGLPSTFALTIRAELEAANKALEAKAARLEAELEASNKARDDFRSECEGRIDRLTKALVDRDLLINELYRRLGLPEPRLTDPRS